ncbi:MAG: NAD(+) synthase [Lachnospiraceae bacterium]|nr:NAD(+) synthase [Lachnospiraceae bacterium]MBO6206406.1 NAD(+) synthase [Lachnospiraceae bacterium]
MDGYNFNAEAVRDRLITMIKEHAQQYGFDKVVLGISGGKDSTVAAALCARALGKENVIGVMLPDKQQADIADSVKVCESVGIKNYTINIGEIHTALLSAVDAIPFSEESNTNVAPRLRMTTLRYVAQALGARLCGTGNLSEATVGYCTKDGDTSCDFNPLGALTSMEVVEVGKTLPELPRELVEKTPNDGLSGKSDEEKLGLKYADIHKYIRFGSCGNAEVDEKIRRKEAANMHKRMRPPILDPLA